MQEYTIAEAKKKTCPYAVTEEPWWAFISHFRRRSNKGYCDPETCMAWVTSSAYLGYCSICGRDQKKEEELMNRNLEVAEASIKTNEMSVKANQAHIDSLTHELS